jgi:hypothetical protein
MKKRLPRLNGKGRGQGACVEGERSTGLEDKMPEYLKRCLLCEASLSSPVLLIDEADINCKYCGTFYQLTRQAKTYCFDNYLLDGQDKRDIIEHLKKVLDLSMPTPLSIELIQRITGKQDAAIPIVFPPSLKKTTKV